VADRKQVRWVVHKRRLASHPHRCHRSARPSPGAPAPSRPV
jgi:hypothetical protein